MLGFHSSFETAPESPCLSIEYFFQWAQAHSLRTMKPVLVAHGLSMAEFDVMAYPTQCQTAL